MIGALVVLFYGLIAILGGLSALVFVLGYKSGV